MSAMQAKKLARNIQHARKNISKMSPKEKENLEKAWDVEHAYYSSTLEGSKVDREEFEKLAKNVK